MSATDRPLRVVVADDEAMARKRLVRLLTDMPDVEIAAQCADAREVLATVREGGVDVLLLDIQMPELSGIDAIRSLPAERPVVVFCTAHAAHAVSAFEVGAIDYLLKPIETTRLRQALDRVRARLPRLAPAPPGDQTAVDRLPLPTRQGIVLVNPRDVTHAHLADELVTVYAAGQSYLSALSLNELESRLPSDTFVRVHRRAILNLTHVAKLVPNEVGGFVAETTDGLTVEVSRQAARDLRRRLGLR
jgi:two-component system LytT family response regulator